MRLPGFSVASVFFVESPAFFFLRARRFFFTTAGGFADGTTAAAGGVSGVISADVPKVAVKRSTEGFSFF